MEDKIMPNNNNDLVIAFYHNEVRTYHIVGWKINDTYKYGIPITCFEYDMEYAIVDKKTDEWYVPNNIPFAGEYEGVGIKELKKQFEIHYDDSDEHKNEFSKECTEDFFNVT